MANLSWNYSAASSELYSCGASRIDMIAKLEQAAQEVTLQASHEVFL